MRVLSRGIRLTMPGFRRQSARQANIVQETTSRLLVMPTRMLQYSGLFTISPGEGNVEQITKQGYNAIAFTFIRDLHDSVCATEELAVPGPRLSPNHLAELLELPSFVLSVSALSPAGQ